MTKRKNRYAIKSSVSSEGLKDIKQLLSKHIFSNEHDMRNFGFLLFLLHWGRRINHKNKTGSFFFSVPAINGEVIVLRKRVGSSSSFWLFIGSDDAPFWSLEYYIVRFTQYLSHGLSHLNSIRIEEFQQLFLKALSDPRKMLDEIQSEEDFVCKISLSQDSQSALLKIFEILEKSEDNRIDPFQLFLYFYLLLYKNIKVVEIEGWVKEWKQRELRSGESAWDVICYDKGESENLLLIEISTGHRADKFISKISNMIQALKKGAYVFYISRFNDKEEDILKLLKEKYRERFLFSNTSIDIESEEDLGSLEEELKKIYNRVMKNLDSVINHMRNHFE